MACIFAGSLRKLVVKMKKLFVSVLVVASFLLCATSCKKEQLSLSRDSSISVTVSEAAALNTKSSAQETVVLESLDPEAPVLYMTSEDYIPSSEAAATKASVVSTANFASRYPQFTMDAIMGGERYMDNVAVRYTDEKWKIDPDSEGVPYHWVWNEATGKYKMIYFWAYAPALDRSKFDGQDETNFRFRYVAPGDQDLLVASQRQNFDEVTLKFYHPLAAFGAFVGQEPDEGIEYIGYSFDGMYTSGKCTCSNAMVGMAGLQITWQCDESVDTKGSYSGTFRTGEYSFNQDDYIFAIPSLNDDSKLTLKYKKGGVEKSSSYMLKGILVKAGKKYVFRLEYPNTATLLNGPEFWTKVNTLVNGTSVIESVEFKTASPISDYGTLPRTEVQAPESKAKIYAVYDSSSKKLTITTHVDKMYSNKSMYQMFRGFVNDSDVLGGCFANLKSIDFGLLNTEKCQDMTSLVDRCTSLESVNIKNFNTSNVTTMYHMFFDCRSLKELEFGEGFSTGEVQNMLHMFYNCNSLTVLDVTGFDTSSAQTLYGMFQGCKSLQSLDLSNFNTENVTNTQYMFYGCMELNTLTLGDRFTLAKTEYMQYMFGLCYKIKELNFNGFDTPKASNIRAMFYECRSLSNIDLSKFKTSSATSSAYMFYNCQSLEELKLGTDFNVRNVTEMTYMFYNCVKLKTLDIRQFETAKVVDMTGVFMQCKGLEELYFDKNKFKTSSVTKMKYMFDYCQSLKSLDLSGFDTSKVETFERMFSVCSTLESLDLSGFVTSSATTMAQMFDACSGLKTLNLGSFNTTGVTDMTRMFTGCKALENLNVSNFDTANVSTMNAMFFACEGLKKLDLTNFNTSHVVDMTSMLQSCLRLAELKLGTDFKVASTKVSMMADCAANLPSANLICTDATWSDITSGTDINTTIWHHTTL